MLTSHPNSVIQKRDLHVGGLGFNAAGALAAVADPEVDMNGMEDAAERWLNRIRDAARDADDYVHNNPWPALAAVGLVGLAVGYLLSRRLQP